MNNLYTVFFRPDDSIGDDVFNLHLDEHIFEVLEVPGFLACRRYRLRLTKGNEYPSQFNYLNLYEVEGPAAEVHAALRVPVPGRGHPDWWRDVKRSASFAEAIDGDLDPTTAATQFLVFSSPSVVTPPEDFERWYGDHAAENVRSTRRLGHVSRYRVQALTGSDTLYPAHLAVYSLQGTAEEMLAETHAAQSRGEVSSTDELRVFASFESIAIGERQVE